METRRLAAGTAMFQEAREVCLPRKSDEEDCLSGKAGGLFRCLDGVGMNPVRLIRETIHVGARIFSLAPVTLLCRRFLLDNIVRVKTGFMRKFESIC